MDKITIQMMDITSLKAVICDLRKTILPSRFEKAQQPESNTIQLGFRTLSGLFWLEASWDPDAPRIICIPSPKRLGEESTLAKQLKHGLQMMALTEIKQQGFERIFELGFAKRPGENIKKKLVFEIMGRHSNLILLDKKQKIITLGKQVKEKQSRFRPISTGDIYSSPPPLKGIEPNLKESLEEWKQRLSLLPLSLKKSLHDNYQGISPSIALQLVDSDSQKAKEILNIKVNELSSKYWNKIYQNWQRWLKALAEERLSIVREGPTDYRAWLEDQSTKNEGEQPSYILSEYYKHKLSEKDFIRVRANLKKRISKAKEEEEKLLIEKKKLLKQTEDHRTLRQDADQLLCLESPRKDEIRKAQKLYKKAQKLLRSKVVLEKRIKYHHFRLQNLNETDFFIDGLTQNYKTFNSTFLEKILELQKEVDNFLIPSKKAVRQHTRKRKDLIKPLEIYTKKGLLIQIGRNHSQNEFISLKNARKGDTWFHAQECPGSHIVLKTSCSLGDEEDFQLAADLAALFSRAKGNKVFPVIMVPIENLKKIQGAIPGTVSHHGGEVMWGNTSRAMQHIQP